LASVDGSHRYLAFSVNRASRLKGTRHIIIINVKSETKMRERTSDARPRAFYSIIRCPSHYTAVEPVWLILN